MYTDPEGRYNITKAYDGRTRSTYIELFAQDDTNASFVLIRTNVESMQDSVHIANTFLLYAGILVLIVASGIMLVASGRVVRPIKQLSEIAKRMSALDFTSKYEGRSHDEIGELGESINTLSEKLEETISDLKSVNNRLQSDIEQKIQVDEIRKEFLANVTHELKTPIALISGYAEGLKDCINDDAESRDYYCDVIIDEAGKMNTMVKKLLTLNQIEFGNQIIELKRFDICEVIRSVLNASDVLIKNKGAKLLVNAKGPINVWADEYMVEEVFTNYLTNALNHCENEMIVDVKAETKGKTVRISVFNTGKPIPEEDIDKIWIKFYKVDKARTREYGGSGIGLSIVKAIMEAHNKPYGVINHSNGVEFWFELDSDTKI
ncbi:MAG: HAMP domain-containing histidine kinase [Lachnospiraceae bacterium]|nr:HAMP domain-containing histidine kinase [Lachnospiraceae bacterium]